MYHSLKNNQPFQGPVLRRLPQGGVRQQVPVADSGHVPGGVVGQGRRRHPLHPSGDQDGPDGLNGHGNPAPGLKRGDHHLHTGESS